MQLEDATRARIDSLIASDRVVLFMKGTRQMPQCGFSAATVGILDSLLPGYTTVDVLADAEVREGIKAYSSWPTIPQLYIDNEFVGGCDIVKQMFNTGALHETLGAEPPDRTPPEIAFEPAAAELVRGAMESQPGMAVHLQIDARWQHGFSLGRAEGHEVVASSEGIEVLMDVATAQRANGLKIGVEETLQGTAFRIDNPNAPPPVAQISATELKARIDAGDEVHLFDVRPPGERERARIEGAVPLDEDGMRRAEALPAGAFLVFYCHVGQRSQAAAEHFRLQGFTSVHNLAGGIQAWSQDVDPEVPQY